VPVSFATRIDRWRSIDCRGGGVLLANDGQISASFRCTPRARQKPALIADLRRGVDDAREQLLDAIGHVFELAELRRWQSLFAKFITDEVREQVAFLVLGWLLDELEKRELAARPREHRSRALRRAAADLARTLVDGSISSRPRVLFSRPGVIPSRGILGRCSRTTCASLLLLVLALAVDQRWMMSTTRYRRAAQPTY
jgi:hypothetical protein